MARLVARFDVLTTCNFLICSAAHATKWIKLRPLIKHVIFALGSITRRALSPGSVHVCCYHILKSSSKSLKTTDKDFSTLSILKFMIHVS